MNVCRLVRKQVCWNLLFVCTLWWKDTWPWLVQFSSDGKIPGPSTNTNTGKSEEEIPRPSSSTSTNTGTGSSTCTIDEEIPGTGKTRCRSYSPAGMSVATSELDLIELIKADERRYKIDCFQKEMEQRSWSNLSIQVPSNARDEVFNSLNMIVLTCYQMIILSLSYLGLLH